MEKNNKRVRGEGKRETENVLLVLLQNVLEIPDNGKYFHCSALEISLIRFTRMNIEDNFLDLASLLESWSWHLRS